MRKIGPAVVLGLLALAVLIDLPVVRRSGSTCVVCRLWKRDVRLGIIWTTYQETECSRYYAEHVEPVHQHVWGWKGSVSMVNLFGRPVGIACGDRHPILSLGSEDQMAIYRHFEDPAEARRMFLETGGAGREDWKRGRLVVSAIADWYVAGFPGPWESWRDRCLAQQHPGRGDEALHGPPDLRGADSARPPAS